MKTDITLQAAREQSGKAVTAKVADYSQKKFGKRLCYNCQPKSNGDNPF